MIAFEVIENNGGQDSPTYPPKRNTTSLELLPEEREKAEIARNQLLNLTKKSVKKKTSPVSSDNENLIKSKMEAQKVEIQTPPSSKQPPVTEIIYDGKPTMSNLSSAIISKEEIENEIRKKMTKSDAENENYDIEIPQEELILSEIAPATTSKEVEQVQLDGQELIDILEGNPEGESETYEVIGENGMIYVKPSHSNQEPTSYEIVSPEMEISLTKKKMLERQIAIQQIASMPMRKNRRLNSKTGQKTSGQTLAQSLAMDWNDDKEEDLMYELVDVEESPKETSKIKILNMTILNDPSNDKNVTKSEPKILNINAPKPSPPKILNKNAPQVLKDEPATFKRNRVIKKKQIWDPSSSSVLPIEKKSPIALPAAITIKKLTKESIASNTVQTPINKKGKKKSEIEKLFQDEGAVNMIYSLERRNNNQDVPEVKLDDKQVFVDKTEEKSALIAKQESIKQTIIKQSTSPPELKTSSRPQRIKRDLTPSKPVSKEEKTPEKALIVTKVQKNTSAGRKKKTDDTWDFVRNAQTTCDDAMIIRRHSSSSYSSSAPTSPRRLSLDQFTKPQEKKSLESPKDLKSSAVGLVQELRNTLSNALSKGKAPGVRGRKRVATVQESPQLKRVRGTEKEFSVKNTDGVVHVNVLTNQFTISLLIDLKTLLSQLESDINCKIVLITASDELSHGLDYSTLVQNTVEKRKQAASDLVTALK